MQKGIMARAALAAFALSGCSAAGDADTWLNYRSAEQVDAIIWDELPADQVAHVSTTRINEARTLLSQQPVYRLSEMEAEQLLGADRIPRDNGRDLFLVRAVRSSDDHGAFRYLRGGDAIVVLYGSLGPVGSSEYDAVVMRLERQPTTLFVERSVAR